MVKIWINGSCGKGISNTGRNIRTSCPIPGDWRAPARTEQVTSSRIQAAIGWRASPHTLPFMPMLSLLSDFLNSVLVPRGPRLSLRVALDSPSPLNHPRSCQYRPCLGGDRTPPPALSPSHTSLGPLHDPYFGCCKTFLRFSQTRQEFP